MDIRTAVDVFLTDTAAQVAKTTAARYCSSMVAFTNYLAQTGLELTAPLDALEIRYFIDYPTHMLKSGLRQGTVKNYLAVSLVFLKYLELNDLHEYPGSQVAKAQEAAKQATRKHEKRLPKTPEAGAVEKVVKGAHDLSQPSPLKERNLAIVLFLVSTGCRINEAAQLKIRDLNLSEKSARVIGKGSKERIAFFNDAARAALTAYWQARGFQGRNDPVFTRHDRGAGSEHKTLSTAAMRDAFRLAVMTGDVDPHEFTPHSARHAFAIKLLRETKNIVIVKNALGHAALSSTQGYAEVYPDELETAYRGVFDK